MEKLLVSPSPHLHTKTSTKSLMRDVVIALLPAVVAQMTSGALCNFCHLPIRPVVSQTWVNPFLTASSGMENPASFMRPTAHKMGLVFFVWQAIILCHSHSLFFSYS